MLKCLINRDNFWLQSFWSIKKLESRICAKAISTSALSRKGICCLLITASFCDDLLAQKTSLEYLISKGGTPVGTLHFSRQIKKDSTVFKLETKVHSQFPLPVKVWAKEEAHYYKGVLQKSSLYRKVNNKEKVNKWMRLNKNHYIITQGVKTVKMSLFPIGKSILSIFCEEPQNSSKLYSDNYQQFIPIHKIEAHKYKVVFPDGNYNYYYFKNGLCTQVDVHHKFYTLKFLLKG